MLCISAQSKNTVRDGYLLLLTILSAGVLVGCQYCEPLLLACLTSGVTFYLLPRQTASAYKQKNTIDR